MLLEALCRPDMSISNKRTLLPHTTPQRLPQRGLTMIHGLPVTLHSFARGAETYQVITVDHPPKTDKSGQ